MYLYFILYHLLIEIKIHQMLALKQKGKHFVSFINRNKDTSNAYLKAKRARKP
jgi:hypothetical protein